MTQLLTHSRQDTFKTCRKRHWFAYEQAIRPVDDAKALRMGAAYHDALECLEKGGGIDAACDLIYSRYNTITDTTYDPQAIEYEQETVLRLVCGYVWRWEESGLKFLAAEQTFELPLINPETKKSTPSFLLAGKIDGIVELEDGRLAVIEHKLLGEDIDSDAVLWRRLRIDHQISLYVLAARRLGFAVDTVLYNVCQKPTIKPTNMPILDELGAKIVVDQRGNRVKTEKGCWRQTGDSNKGYHLQQRPMTSEEWGKKLAADIAEQPERYFARHEIPRLDQDLEEYETELWSIQKTLREAQLKNHWFRTCNRNTCQFCSYFELCSTKHDLVNLPEGFVRVSDIHPELKADQCQPVTS